MWRKSSGNVLPSQWRRLSWIDQREILEGMDREARDAAAVQEWQEAAQRAQARKRPVPPRPKPTPIRSALDPAGRAAGKQRAVEQASATRAATEYPTALPAADDDLTAPGQGKSSPFAVRRVVYTGPIPISQEETRAAIRRDAEKAIAAAQGRHG